MEYIIPPVLYDTLLRQRGAGVSSALCTPMHEHMPDILLYESNVAEGQRIYLLVEHVKGCHQLAVSDRRTTMQAGIRRYVTFLAPTRSSRHQVPRRNATHFQAS